RRARGQDRRARADHRGGVRHRGDAPGGRVARRAGASPGAPGGGAARMKLVFALAASLLFGTGAYLLLNRDLVRVVLGIVLVSQAATLTLIESGLSRGAA